MSLLEEQQFILKQILEQLEEQKADAVLIAGDIYDKAVPSAEAVRLLDWFLTQLADRDLPVLLVSGNHDSAERLAFGAKLLDSRKIHLSPVFEGVTEPVVLQDQYGEIRVYLLPFIKPVHARRVFPDQEILDYTDAIGAVVEGWNIDPARRNVLIAHQLVTGAQRSESEGLSIGGLDDVDVRVFDPFDYVALGHLHRAQWIGRETVRYSGTPLAYSFSEGGQNKTLTWVTLGEKGQVTITETLLHPNRQVTTRKGEFEDLIGEMSSDYLRIILTDEDDIPNAWSRLRYRYPNLLRLEYDNLRTRTAFATEPSAGGELSPLELLEDFYVLSNGRAMDEDQRKLAKAWMEELWEDGL